MSVCSSVPSPLFMSRPRRVANGTETDLFQGNGHIHAVVSEVTIPLSSARSRECTCVFMCIHYIVYLYCVCMCTRSVPLIGVIR